MVLWGAHSDRTGERIWHVALPLLLGGVGLRLVGLDRARSALTMIALTLATLGIYAAIGTFWSLPTAILTGTAPRPGSRWSTRWAISAASSARRSSG